MNLTKKDIQRLNEHGLSANKVYSQLETLSNGIPFKDIITAATLGNGIEVISTDNQQKLITYFEDRQDKLELIKFIPASGAATRMFKFLFHFLEDYNPKEEKLNSYLKKQNDTQLATFINSIKDFAFLSSARKKIRENYPNFKHSTKGMRLHLFVKTMLEEKGLNFAKFPKGLIPFHKYQKYATTAFEEHIFETTFFASIQEKVYLHFTFSRDHVPYFKKEYNEIKNRVSKKTKTEVHISYSFQKPETDTIALNENNRIVRNSNNEIIFRPSGHGSLLENLNDINADLIFIKNIDNVAAEEYVEEIAYYKKVLAGKLLWVQEKVFFYIKKLKKETISNETLNEVKSFLWNELNIKEPPIEPYEMVQVLNRPLRVCGVVKNTGAPGGGPFWIKNEKGEVTLQIVEMSQINDQDPRQKTMIHDATHFNPVDIVCGVKDYNGKKFDLSQYVDRKSGIITQKYQDGKPLKVLELPGLWNGAMADWNSTFVEVPLLTFNPVKTINDLLNKEHRPNA